ncbi:unnamed protein product [Leptosia nina]|uniref:Uncharacterized protein n=1 Tax=Leptosia nina TaxID=320188 RepID=A0AAV1JB40_9NEOP
MTDDGDEDIFDNNPMSWEAEILAQLMHHDILGLDILELNIKVYRCEDKTNKSNSLIVLAAPTFRSLSFKMPSLKEMKISRHSQ